jgi:carbon monoxide dehydrogenase subunit G
MPKEQSVVASVEIKAPPEAVWEVACETGRYAEWVESTIEVVRTDGPARLGATYDELTRISGPWKASTHWRVTEFDPPRRQVHVGEGVATARGMAVVIELTVTGEDTRLTLSIRYTPRFGPIGVLIDSAVRGSLRRAQERSAEAFAALVAHESSAGSLAPEAKQTK